MSSKQRLKTNAGRAAAPPARGRKPRRRISRAGRTSVLLRWCVVAGLGFMAFLYYRPLTTYLETHRTVGERAAEVQALRTERTRLQTRLARTTSDDTISREARRIGYVRPGEQLFIVKGIPQWRHARRSTLRGDE